MMYHIGWIRMAVFKVYQTLFMQVWVVPPSWALSLATSSSSCRIPGVNTRFFSLFKLSVFYLPLHPSTQNDTIVVQIDIKGWRWVAIIQTSLCSHLTNLGIPCCQFSSEHPGLFTPLDLICLLFGETGSEHLAWAGPGRRQCRGQSEDNLSNVKPSNITFVLLILPSFCQSLSMVPI